MGAITPAALTVTANNTSKTYDAQAYSGGAGVTYTGFVAGQTASVLSGTLSYSGTSQGALNAGTYTITPGGLSSSNYAISYVNGSLVINRAGLSAISGSLTGSVGKVYDGTNTATLSSSNFLLTGWLGSDGATITKTSGTYDSANAGTGKTVTVNLSASDFSPTGSTVLANYTLPTSISGAVGAITPAALVISGITATDKVYDGITAAVVSTAGVVKTGIIAGDVVNILATGSFTDKNAGSNKTVNLNTTLSGASLPNYTVTSQASTTANITPATLTISGIAASDKVYDGSTTVSINTTGAIKAGLVAGDVVNLSATGVFADKNVGNGKVVSINSLSLGGTDAANYRLASTSASTTASITKANLLVTGVAANDKIFDGTNSATVTGGRISPIGSDAVSLSAASATFNDATIGTNKPVATFYTLAGTDAGNYNVVQPTGLTASINANPASTPSVQQLAVVPTVTVAVIPPRVPLVTIISSGAVASTGTSVTTSGTPPLSTAASSSTTPSTNTASTSTGSTASSLSTAASAGSASQPASGSASSTTSTTTNSSTSSTTTAIASGTGTPVVIEATGSLTPIASSTTSSGSSNQGGASFVAVKTFDIVKVAPGTSFTLTLPENTFTHSVSTTPLQISATTASGSPLPDWVKFSPGERRFTGTPPVGVTSLQVMVVATDTNGNQVSTTLTLQFGDPSR